MSSSIVRDQISSVQFTMNTDSEMRAMSVLEITSPLAFDQLGHPLPNGLYDPRLGPLEVSSKYRARGGQTQKQTQTQTGA